MPRSGSKSAKRPRELAAWQLRVLGIVRDSDLVRELTFGGGAALAAVHLHHRTSADVDFFSMRPFEPMELDPIRRRIATSTTAVERELVGPRTSLILRRRSGDEIGRVDFAYDPYDPIGRRTTWRGLTIEALTDMTVNKVQAVLTRFQPRDFVDLYFLLREGPERDLEVLLDHTRAKFDTGVNVMGLAARLLLVHDLRELPHMLRPVTLAELVEFFEGRVRELAKAR